MKKIITIAIAALLLSGCNSQATPEKVEADVAYTLPSPPVVVTEKVFVEKAPESKRTIQSWNKGNLRGDRYFCNGGAVWVTRFYGSSAAAFPLINKMVGQEIVYTLCNEKTGEIL